MGAILVILVSLEEGEMEFAELKENEEIRERRRNAEELVKE